MRPLPHFFQILALALAVASTDAANAGTPSRVVSVNLCTDEVLLALADPDQIAALSPYATDAAMTVLAGKATGFRHDAGNAETVVGLKPDLVLAGRFSDRAMRDILKRLGYPVVEFDSARSVADSLSQIRAVAALVGHPERGEAIAATILAAEKRAVASTAGRRTQPTAVLYQRRGYATGGDTLTSELISRVGLTNDGAKLAGRDGGFVSLERLIAARPDYLIVDTPLPRAEDQGTALLVHPALAELYPAARRIVLPERLTVCGGVSLAEAIDRLSAETARVLGAGR